jgi:phospholipase C
MTASSIMPPLPALARCRPAGRFAGASTVSTLGEYHNLRAPGAEGDDLNLRGRPYGLGPRVPMYVLSPWSRGGRVHSEVSDHTSVIRFMEPLRRAEPNISPWRRAVCSDLTSAFDFAQRADAARAARRHGPPWPMRPPRGAPAPSPTARRPSAPEPAAALAGPGIRPACPARYRLEVRRPCSRPPEPPDLLAGAGLAGVFQVYDRLRLDLVPRRFTVEPGKQLRTDWPLHGEKGAYDLWVLGPAGFHRAFVGHRGEQAMLGWQIAGDLRVTASAGCGCAGRLWPPPCRLGCGRGRHAQPGRWPPPMAGMI